MSGRPKWQSLAPTCAPSRSRFSIKKSWRTLRRRAPIGTVNITSMPSTGSLSMSRRSMPGWIDPKYTGMNGCGMMTRPPWSWIAATLSATVIDRLIGFSRNQPRMCVCAGPLVVTSCPATTVRPAAVPRSTTSRALAIVSWSVMAMRFRPALTAASTSSAGVTMPSEANVWQCGSATSTALFLEQCPNEGFGIERLDIVDGLPHSRQFDWNVELGFDRDHCATLGAAVELREHQAGHRDRFVELARLGEARQAKDGVENEQRLESASVERAYRHASDLGELLLQVVLGLQAAGSVDQHDIVAAAARVPHSVEHNSRRICARLTGEASGAGSLRPPE